ncbi:putative MFS-type transporter [Yarrowia sp. C11]|nr:putative MFS-type transporter [Yarrowia sp. E02]KAG5367484.1 putative MFS-type transporter [Yarrowia sp. C11]
MSSVSSECQGLSSLSESSSCEASSSKPVYVSTACGPDDPINANDYFGEPTTMPITLSELFTTPVSERPGFDFEEVVAPLQEEDPPKEQSPNGSPIQSTLNMLFSLLRFKRPASPPKLTTLPLTTMTSTRGQRLDPPGPSLTPPEVARLRAVGPHSPTYSSESSLNSSTTRISSSRSSDDTSTVDGKTTRATQTDQLYTGDTGIILSTAISASQSSQDHFRERCRRSNCVTYIVQWDTVNDPRYPFNWPNYKKYLVVASQALSAIGPQMCSSMYGSAVSHIEDMFGVAKDVAMLSTTVYMMGIAVGPMFCAPMTESFGRKIGVFWPFFVSLIFTFLTVSVTSFPTFMVLRFLSGALSSPPILSSGGALKDMFTPERRPYVLLLYAIIVAGGPAMGPILGSQVIKWTGDFRHLSLVAGVYQLIICSANLVFMPETYAPVILQKIVRNFSLDAGGLRNLVTERDLGGHARGFSVKNLLRPYQIMLTPVMLPLQMYAAIMFGLMYMAISLVPNAVVKEHGWTRDRAAWINLTFIAGLVCASGGIVWSIWYFNRMLKKHGGSNKEPEKRLLIMLPGSLFPPIGCFLCYFFFDQTWAISVVLLLLLGIGFFTIFQSTLNYVVDIHSEYSASAVSALTFLRSIFAGVLPFIGMAAIERVSFATLCLILGIITSAMCAVPWFIFKWGPGLRAKSTFVDV